MNIRTRDGKRVFAIRTQFLNACGRMVTFPVKGSIVDCEKPLRLRYQIWTIDGRASVLEETGDDLIL